MAESIRAGRKTAGARFIERTMRGQRPGMGAYAWVAHRITGLILVAYLLLHIFTLSVVLQGPDAFDRVMATFRNPIVQFLELLLIWIVFWHTLNGLRLILLHFRPGHDQRPLIIGETILTAVVMIASIPIFFR